MTNERSWPRKGSEDCFLPRRNEGKATGPMSNEGNWGRERARSVRKQNMYTRL